MRIYVGNLSFQTTEDTLRDHFSQFGSVEEVSIVSDRQTGRSRGFGFVTMPDDNEARAAIEEANGKDFEGRTLSVNEAKPRTEGGGGGGGGYGGGGGRGGGRGGGGYGGGGGGRGGYGGGGDRGGGRGY